MLCWTQVKSTQPSQTYPECSEGENERTLLYACTSELSPEELARRDIELLKTKLHKVHCDFFIFDVYVHNIGILIFYI